VVKGDKRKVIPYGESVLGIHKGEKIEIKGSQRLDMACWIKAIRTWITRMGEKIPEGEESRTPTEKKVNAWTPR